ncbi:hypothetical protein A2673_04220 [Candidatus Kaiserbacteria bacterium RIFCSPHIGHO2_01_FULL_50_13]|uniref:Cell division protein FtsL n=1 Tax=Candidatus Kaiserbacteria bacterium RIFCSPLOWO2_01_FULL_50_24 TaxID=1798507 RepID=A0A1F6EMY5_9BACT|nr:MAG: hypothetical protein A2673_04220 [Candidatus Kaiserbacteria bacterium RIFCSPHIGHO2_01_FULL_50_13]OGG75013.1 MAG: hypothetical protein A3A34_02610 [Candidatus Kaiserbacteria bacterium RIFCSPLOWO2_01_FULL_50_24]OGG82058.1 MAG: hypothetical protein A3H74_04270 [Candidatus Kaiserbacteria bacterium RIFCSPLOWO2_02_FULL_51_13]
MKNISISISAKHIPALSCEYSLEHTLLRASAGLFIALVCAYVYFVTASVFHVMGSGEAHTEIKRLSGVVASLEQSFFEKTELVTRERGGDLGLVPVAKTTYVQSQNAVVGVTPRQTGI